MYAAMNTKGMNPVDGSFAHISWSLFDNTFTYHAQWRIWLDPYSRSIMINWTPNDLPEDSDPQIAADATIGRLTSDGDWTETYAWSSYAHYTDTGFEDTFWHYHDDEELPDAIIMAGRLRYALPTVYNSPILFLVDMPASYYQPTL